MSAAEKAAKPIMLQIAAATDEHEMWERRLKALRQMYPPERPCFADRDGQWCLRDFIEYASQGLGLAVRAELERSNEG